MTHNNPVVMPPAMTISEILSADRTMHGVKAESKKRALELVSELASQSLPEGVASQDLFESLVERERLGSTGVGKGIAIPHTRHPEITHPIGVFLQLKKPIAYETPDDKPVDLVFGLVVPEANHQEHLDALASVATALRKPALCEALRQAKSDEALYDLLIKA